MLSEDLTPKELLDLWRLNPHKIKLRKEIASHPNADQSVLIEASRLYVSEVLENPSLEFMELFGSEEDTAWIRILKFAYNEPEKFINGVPTRYGIANPFTYLKYRNYYEPVPAIWHDANLNKIPTQFFYDKYYYGILMEATLRGAAKNSLISPLFFLNFFDRRPPSGFKRALKDKKVLSEIKNLSNYGPTPAFFKCILQLWVEGVISTQEIVEISKNNENVPAYVPGQIFHATKKTLPRHLGVERISPLSLSKAYSLIKKTTEEEHKWISILAIRTGQSDSISQSFNLAEKIKSTEFFVNLIKICFEMSDKGILYIGNSDEKFYILSEAFRSYLNRIDYYGNKWLCKEDFNAIWKVLLDIPVPKANVGGNIYVGEHKVGSFLNHIDSEEYADKFFSHPCIKYSPLEKSCALENKHSIIRSYVLGI